MFRRVADYLLAALVLGGLLFAVSRIDGFSERTRLGQAIVHDGDTLTVDGQRVRLKGIDAPEYTQTCEAPGGRYACGRAARAALARLVKGKPVACSGRERDRFDRLLVACTVGDPPLDLNRELVRQGWAVSYRSYGAEELSARNLKLGLWRGDFQRPRDWRAEHQRPQEAERPRDWLSMAVAWLRRLLWP